MGQTTRISIDLCEESGEQRRIIHSSVLTVIGACGEVFKGLGSSRGVVEAFRVTYTTFDERSQLPGPCIKVFFHDPSGRATSFTTDFRFMGDGDPEPSEEEIITHLCDCLVPRLRTFLEECLAQAEKVRDEIKAML